MTDLQVAITAAAVLAVIGVLAYNVRQQMGIQQPKPEPKAEPRRDPKDHEIAVEPDTLMPAEPVVASVSRPANPDAEQEPVAAEDWIAPVTTPSTPQPAQLSEFADAIAVLRWDQPPPAERVWSQVRGWRRVGSKPMHLGWAGQPLTDGGAPMLFAEPDGPQVAALYVGVLMATRAGPLNAMEYSEWKNLLDQLARVTGARLEMPTMTDALARARELDQRCAAVDAQLSLCVTAKQVLSPAAIAAAAQAAALSATGESRFVANDAQHRALFSVFPGDGGNRLVLLLDVPRAAEPVQAFRHMSEAARVMARALSAEVTDEAGKIIAAESLTVIERQIQSRADQLLAMGVEPGSPLALRLFL